MSLTEREDVEHFGVVRMYGTLVQSFVEKPSRKDAPSNLINAGAFIIDPIVLKTLPDGNSSVEKDLLENITKARAGAMDAQKDGDTKELAKMENGLSGMLGKLQIAVEAYPDLKANTNVAQLMDELSDTENKIQASRRFYNTMVRDFNTKIEMFPNNLIAGMLKAEKFSYFELADEKERENIEVKF